MGVAQLTKLLINSETKVSSCTTPAIDVEDSRFAIVSRKSQDIGSFYLFILPTMVIRANSYFTLVLDSRKTAVNLNSFPHGRLAERLLTEGLLTPKILEDLKKEWKNESGDKKERSTNKTISSHNKRSERLKIKRLSRKSKF